MTEGLDRRARASVRRDRRRPRRAQLDGRAATPAALRDRPRRRVLRGGRGERQRRRRGLVRRRAARSSGPPTTPTSCAAIRERPPRRDRHADPSRPQPAAVAGRGGRRAATGPSPAARCGCRTSTGVTRAADRIGSPHTPPRGSTHVRRRPTVSLSVPGKDPLELPRASPPTEGAPGADISKLLAATGPVTYDPGFANTASCTSAITYIDGDAGILRYRGLPDRPAGRALHVPRGQLPADLRRAAERRRSSPSSRTTSAGTPCCTRTSSASSRASRATRTRCPCCPRRCRRCRPSTRTPSTRSTRRTSTLSTYRLLAKLPTIAAYAYKKSVGQPFLYPDNSLGLVENFLRMTFGFPAEPYEVDPVVAKRARPAVHPARRPRAELLDLDRAARRLVAGQPVRLGLGRHQRPVRPAARRRQPVGAGDAAADPRRRAATSRLRQQGQGQGRPASS